MKINSIKIENFRNIEHMELHPGSGVNVICGENAQGKTNLLEAMWLFTGLRSFRGAKEKEFLRFSCPEASLQMEYHNGVRDMEAAILIDEKRHVSVNGISYPSANKTVGEFLAFVFSPNHLTLVQGGPAERRKFMNTALCQIKPNYAGQLAQFNRSLHQRNILLKDAVYHSELLDTLDVWDENFASFGAFLIYERQQYLKAMKPFLLEYYEGLSGGRETINLSYLSLPETEQMNREEIKEALLIALKEHRKEDMLAGVTTVGPHRDDLSITLDGLSVRKFGSQGQQRSSALSLKMSEASMIRKLTGKQPVALLDDVMSELDINRQNYILNHIEGGQVFITCCEPGSILLSRQSESGKLFEVKGGQLCSSI